MQTLNQQISEARISDLDCSDQNSPSDKFDEPSALNKIRDWLKEVTYIHEEIDDVTLLRFLNTSKQNVDGAKFRIGNYYKLRIEAPHWFTSRDPRLPEMEVLLKTGLFLPLLKQHGSGIRTYILRIGAQNPTLSSLDSVFKIIYMILDLYLYMYKETSIVECIFDLSGVTFRHAKQLTIEKVKRGVHSWQDCYPVRLKALHFVNSPVYVDVVLNLFRRFMKPKLKNRVIVHGFNIKSLHEHIPKEVLPEEYGGSEGTFILLQEYWMEEVMKKTQWFSDDEAAKMPSIQ